MQTKKVYQALGQTFQAWMNSKNALNVVWTEKHLDKIQETVREYLPSGSGFDSGTKFLFDESESAKLVFETDFHHMNAHGFYTTWTHHKVIITPDWMGFNIHVTGRDKNMIKDYIADTFHAALDMDLPQ